MTSAAVAVWITAEAGTGEVMRRPWGAGRGRAVFISWGRYGPARPAGLGTNPLGQSNVALMGDSGKIPVMCESAPERAGCVT